MSKGIKTKATVKDVKALDKSAVAAERMKQAYIRRVRYICLYLIENLQA